MTTVLKLGGSVITEKGTPETVDEAALEMAASIIGSTVNAPADTDADADADGSTDDSLVVVHGGGSFGHPAAAAHDVSATTGTHDSGAIRAIHQAMGRLNEQVLDALQEAGAPAVPVRPLSLVHRSADETVHYPKQPVASMLAEGFVPVLHGDVVLHEGRGATILSGDDLVVGLARTLDADRVGVCSTTPGVLDQSGAVIPEITSFDAVAEAVGESESTDVTGGMAAKVQALLELEGRASIFDLDSLQPFLKGGRAGTEIR